MKFHHKIFIIAIIVYSLTAFFSVGYFHEDENYQIIEFAGILDGTNEPKDLAWEYKEQIRSAIQPVIVYFIFQVCDFLSISNPYSKTFILRLITALLSLCIIFYFSESCKKTVPPEYRKLFLILTYFLWFLPFLNVRCSSETWSGIFLLLSTTLIIRNYNNYSSYTILGGLLGLSFLFRYQIAFAVIGLILWLFFIRKEQILKIGIILISFQIVVVFGIFIDSWYYGEWTVTLRNYFIVNLIESKAASFGTSPWYYYFFFIFRYSFFPIGIAILLSFIFVVFRRYKNIIVWIILPFFIGHSLISHKELRFLFPLINFIPILIIMALDIISMNKWNYFAGNITKAFLIVIFSINVISLVIVCVKPAGIGRVRITENIREINNKERLNVIYSPNCNPYSPWGLTTNFYKEFNASFFNINSYLSKRKKSYDTDTRTVLVFSQADIKNEQIQGLIQNMNMKETCKSFPNFMLPFLKIYGYKTNEILIVYRN